MRVAPTLLLAACATTALGCASTAQQTHQARPLDDQPASVTHVPSPKGPLPWARVTQHARSDASRVEDQLLGNLEAFRFCYQKKLEENPTAAGSVILTFSVDELGFVYQSTIARDDLLIGPCLKAHLDQMVFDVDGRREKHSYSKRFDFTPRVAIHKRSP